VVLVTGIGWALQHFADLPNALVFGLLIGVVLAQLVPTTNSCAIRRKPRADLPS